MKNILTIIFLLWSTSAVAYQSIDFTCYFTDGWGPQQEYIFPKNMQFNVAVYEEKILGTSVELMSNFFTDEPYFKDKWFSSLTPQIMLNQDATIPPNGIIHSFYGVDLSQPNKPVITYEDNIILGLRIDQHMLSSRFNVYTGELFLMQGKHPSMHDFLLNENQYISATYMCQRSQSLLN